LIGLNYMNAHHEKMAIWEERTRFFRASDLKNAHQ